jgi:hypothetical protein
LQIACFMCFADFFTHEILILFIGHVLAQAELKIL